MHRITMEGLRVINLSDGVDLAELLPAVWLELLASNIPEAPIHFRRLAREASAECERRAARG